MAECDVCLEAFDQWYKVSGYGCCSGLFCVDCKKNLNTCPYCRSAINVEKDDMDIIAQMEKKYGDLVWIARSHPMEDDDYWAGVPADIKQKVLAAQNRILEAYPPETFMLAICDDNWEHGFNSGMLAAIRYVRTLLDKSTDIDPDTDQEFPVGGRQAADDEFPFLDT